MRALLMRHGDAVDPRTVSDALRHLSIEGREACLRMGITLRERGHRVTHVYTSPLVRAVQSAELFAQGVGFEGTIVVHPHLVPDGTTARALSVLDVHGPDDVIALVTHEPIVRAMASHLIGSAVAPFSTAGVALIELPGGRLVERVSP